MKDKNSGLIAAYLLQRSYINSQLDLNNSLGKRNPKPSLKQLDDNDYISISTLGKGSGGTVELVYSIKTELLYAMKIHYEQDSPLMKREIANYLKAKGPFIPRFYGTIIHESHQGFIIDYIAGHSLTQIKKLNIQDLYKLLMILQLLQDFESLHKQNFIYRDLKPDNIIITDNMNLYLIDYDRMIENIDDNKGEQATVDFGHCFFAPEIVSGQDFSFEADVYSLGALIYFMVNEKDPKKISDENNDSNKLQFDNFNPFFKNFESTCKKCTQIEPSKRPTISQLIVDFLSFFYENYNVGILSNPELTEIFIKLLGNRENTGVLYYKLGLAFYGGMYVKKDLNKAIRFITLSANQNNSDAQSMLGLDSLY